MPGIGAIVLTGLAANDPVPGAYLEINFAQGPAAGSSSPREILLIGNMLSTGNATPDTVVYGPDTPVQMQTEQDVITLFGTGSELHRMYLRAARIVGEDVVIRAIAVTESAGVQAKLVINISVTATANGFVRTYVGDEFVDTPFSLGDAPSVIAAAMVTSINQMTRWPITAASAINGAGPTYDVTLTARQKGLRGNWLRGNAVVFGNGAGVISDKPNDGYFTGGTVADSNATALTTINPHRYYYIVSAAEDATQLGALCSQVNSQAAPTVGIRQRVFAGSVDSLANGETVATGINGARAEITWLKNADWTPAELAANAAGVYAKFEAAANPRTNFAFFGNDATTQAYWKVPASRDTAAAPTRTDIKSALNNGLTPIGVNPNGSTYLVDRITTRSLNGSVNDYRIRDAHKVTICDFFGDDLLAKTVLQFSGKRIADDPVQGQRPPGPLVVTPKLYRACIFGLLNDYDANDLLQNLQQIKDATIVQRETNPTTRMSARIPLQPCDNAKQFAIALDQVA